MTVIHAGQRWAVRTAPQVYETLEVVEVKGSGMIVLQPLSKAGRKKGVSFEWQRSVLLTFGSLVE